MESVIDGMYRFLTRSPFFLCNDMVIFSRIIVVNSISTNYCLLKRISGSHINLYAIIMPIYYSSGADR
jgi:hypothetical protein